MARAHLQCEILAHVAGRCLRYLVHTRCRLRPRAVFIVCTRQISISILRGLSRSSRRRRGGAHASALRMACAFSSLSDRSARFTVVVVVDVAGSVSASPALRHLAGSTRFANVSCGFLFLSAS